MTDKITLKSWFSRGKKPTAAQFAEWIDSYWHKGERIQIASVDNLPQMLANKQDKTDNGLDTTNKTIVGAINELNEVKVPSYRTFAGIPLSSDITDAELIEALGCMTVVNVSPADFVAMNVNWPAETSGFKAVMVSDGVTSKPAFVNWHYEGVAFHCVVFGFVRLGDFGEGWVVPSENWHVLSGFQNTSNPTWTLIARNVSNLQEAYESQGATIVELDATSTIRNGETEDFQSAASIRLKGGNANDGEASVNVNSSENDAPAEVNMSIGITGATTGKIGVRISNNVTEAFVSGVPLKIEAPVEQNDAATKSYVDNKPLTKMINESVIVAPSANYDVNYQIIPNTLDAATTIIVELIGLGGVIDKAVSLIVRNDSAVDVTIEFPQVVSFGQVSPVVFNVINQAGTLTLGAGQRTEYSLMQITVVNEIIVNGGIIS